jgi:hypothetical protein
MQMYGGQRRRVPLVLNLGTRWRSVVRPEVLKLWGAPPPRIGILGGGRRLYEGHIYFEINMGAG